MDKLISKMHMSHPQSVILPPSTFILHRGVLRLCAAVALSLCVVGVAYGQQTEPDPPVCERSPLVQTAILAQGQVPVTSCGAVTLAHLAGITGSITIIGATTLKAGDFNDLPKVQLLQFHLGGALQTLPAGMFEGVGSGVVLHLINNPFSQGLPSELIERFKSRSGMVNIDLVAVNDILPATLRVSVGEMKDLDLRDAFFQSDGHSRRSAGSYEITVADPTVATTEISGHTLMITVLQEGQTEIEVAGILDDQRAMQTITLAEFIADPPVCERTQQVRDAIVAAVDGVDDCNDITAEHLAGIGGAFDFNEQGAVTLVRGDLNGLSGVTRLDLNSAWVLDFSIGIPSGIFDEMTGLEEIDIGRNGIIDPDVPPNLFANNSELRIIELGRNGLRSPGYDLFAGLANLEELYLYRNDIIDLEANVFSDLSSLRVLDLSDNEFIEGDLPLGLFDNLGSLKTLNLSGNEFLSAVEFGLFDGLDLDAFTMDMAAMTGALPTTVILTGEEASTTLDLESAFVYGVGGGILPADSYEVQVGDERIFLPSLSGNNLRIDALVSNGQTTVTVIGYGSGSSATQTFTVELDEVMIPLPNPPMCERTAEVQSVILNLIGAMACDEVILVDLAAVGRIGLSIMNVRTLKAGDFNDMPNIVSIDLGSVSLNNELQTLPAGMFEGVRSDVFLELRNNPFSEGLPSELIERFKSRSGNVNLDLAAVNDILTTLNVSVGRTRNVDLEDAFVQASGGTFSSAGNYETAVVDDEVATVTETVGHTLRVKALQEGQTKIEVVGILGDQRATQTFTVAAEPANNLIFRIKVFLEGAQ